MKLFINKIPPLIITTLAFIVGCQSQPTVAGTISAQLENDSFDGASDAYYTQGMQLAYTSDDPDSWPNRYLPWLARDRQLRPQYYLGQAIFTPYEIGESRLQEDDRPYAGWLYLGAAVIAEKLEPENHLKIIERFEMSVGIVGPSSGAERLQRWSHELIGTYEVNGWENQLRDEPVLLAGYARKWAYIHPVGQSALDWEMSATLGGTVGNVTTQLVSGLGLRLGSNLNSSTGINGIPPATVAPYYGMPSGGGWHVFAEWQQRFVSTDIFLDGNSDKASHWVEKKPRIAEWRFGLTFASSRYLWTLYHVRRSQEFFGQYENATFSGLGLATGF